PFKNTLNFNCSDAIVECEGNILLIERKSVPGAGTWALAGGFKNSDETFLDCAIRELVEETNLKVPEKVLRGSIVNKRLFDFPNRGMGIARNTLAVHIRISPDNSGKLPKVKASDDAKSAKWVSLHDALNNHMLFDDHAAIISTMTGVNPIPAYLNSIHSK
ncbi:NUDIX domain-containing protein, partial [bacterium]|nr:NUDIX domain-containing protein [bacterium]